MAVNSSEAFLTSISEGTFLKPWCYPNPFRKAGKEITDMLVVFGNDVIIFSDKAISFRDGAADLAWKRWYKRAVEESIDQLSGAYKVINSGVDIFIDDRASKAFPFALPDLTQRRVHLIAVTHPSREIGVRPALWTDFCFDGNVIGDGVPFSIGPTKIRNHHVHVFDGKILEVLLKHLSTASDFVQYLLWRFECISRCERLSFFELDLLAYGILGRTPTTWPQLPADNQDLSLNIRGCWEEYLKSEQLKARDEYNKKSYTIDRLIDHFHEEYIAGRNYHDKPQAFSSHEKALRIIGSESRFGRRIISEALYELLREEDRKTFWASTVASREVNGVRYVWLVYPKTPESMNIEIVERFLFQHLVDHIMVACSVFRPEILIGLLVPNIGVDTGSHMVVCFDGTIWTHNHQTRANELQKNGIFANLEASTTTHVF